MNHTRRTWIKVVLVDEDPLSCLYFNSLLEHAQGIQCDRILSQSGEIQIALNETDPDIMLVDVGTPEVPGVATVRRIRQHSASLPIMMIASNDSDDLLYQALCAGASGYLLRNMSPEDMLVAICECHARGAIMNEVIARRALNLFQCCDEDTLSEVELIVLGLLSRGKSINEISRKMLTSRHAVKKEIYHVYAKLNTVTTFRHEHKRYVNESIAEAAIVTKV